MNKLLIVLLTLLTLLSACSIKVKEDLDPKQNTYQPNKEEVKNDSKEDVKTENLWVEYKTLQEAIKEFGKDVELPEKISNYGQIIFRVIKEDYLDVFYGDPNAEATASIRISYDKTNEDISGVYYDYPYKESVEELKLEVLGEKEGDISLANWSDTKHNYSLYLKYPMTLDEIKELIKVVK